MKHLTGRMMGAWLAMAPVWALAATAVEEQRPMAADGTIAVSNVSGAVAISTWDQAEFRLEAELGKHQELEISESGARVTIEVVQPEARKDWDEARLTLVVPVRASIVAEGVSADIEVSGSRGEHVSVESVSGDLEVGADSARVELSTVSGDIRFVGSAARSAAESVSGDIELRGVGGEVSISTVSGDATLLAGDVEEGRFESVSGTLELSLAAAEGGRITVESMSGDVRITLPASQQGEFQAQTFSGDIQSAFGAAEAAASGPGNRLRHRVGEGGARIRIESFSGDVQIGQK